MPLLPRSDFKIVIRPRGGLEVATTGTVRLASAIYRAANVPAQEAGEDTVCSSNRQNIIVGRRGGGRGRQSHQLRRQVALEIQDPQPRPLPVPEPHPQKDRNERHRDHREVKDCSDVRAYAAHQSGRVDELRYQLRLAHRQACVAPVAAAPVPSLARTYAQAVNHGLPLPSSAVHPAAAPVPGAAPPAHPDLAVPARPDVGYRREHAHIMFLTPIAPSSAPARDVATLLSANLDPVTVVIGDISMNHTRHGITVFTDDKQSLERLKSAIETMRSRLLPSRSEWP
ncbi:hypothetical protein HPB49_011317 [Dermacentor silvarum]|uniref:Uncharacterized protein n=1 Tax=Dermacentor silvarum TaxID=543639 RepID=A0ACB8D5C4_DERSI|nr:hypothetical protein HPB49_011317 [Dermacentor silvarum]